MVELVTLSIIGILLSKNETTKKNLTPKTLHLTSVRIYAFCIFLSKKNVGSL